MNKIMKNTIKNSDGFIVPLILAAVLVVLIVGGLWFYGQGERSFTNFVNKPQQSPIPKMEVATDPSFKEVKGAIISGFPIDFPVYPGAELEASAKTNTEGMPDRGYRVKWVTHEGVIKVMDWYLAEFKKTGWVITEAPTDPKSPGEQVTHIKKGMFDGYIAAETEGTDGEVEIVADLSLVK